MSGLSIVPDLDDFYFDSEPVTVGQFTIGVGGRPNAKESRFAICSREHGIVEFSIPDAAEAIARLIAKEPAA